MIGKVMAVIAVVGLLVAVGLYLVALWKILR